MVAEAPKLGQKLTVTAGRWAADGTSRSQLESGWELRVHGLIPGELCEVGVTHISGGGRVAWGVRESLLQPHPARRPPPCAVAEQCGACGLLHVGEGDQFRLKVESALPDLPSVLTETLVQKSQWTRSPQALSYRHKAVFIPQIAKQRLVLGGYGRGTHDVVDLPHCEVLSPSLRKARYQIHSVLEQDIQTSVRLVRSLILRANRAGEVLVTVILWQDAGQDFLQRLKHLIDGQGPVVGLHIQQHRAEGNRVSGLGPVEHLAGEPRLEEKVLGRPFQIRPLAFFQVNPDVLEKIILLLRERLPALSRPGQTDDPVPTLLDLYCGGGVLGLGILGDDIRWHLIGIDSTAEGIQDARNNAEKLRPGRATFIEGNVEEMLGEEQLREAQVAVIDPPRAGLRAEALRALAESGPPVLFYVACSTAALARDSRALMASGYVPEFLCPADMMPQTPYVEWIAGFRRP